MICIMESFVKNALDENVAMAELKSSGNCVITVKFGINYSDQPSGCFE